MTVGNLKDDLDAVGVLDPHLDQSPRLGRGFPDDGTRIQVHVCRGECGKLRPAEASERGQQDQRPAAEPDSVGQGVDLRQARDSNAGSAGYGYDARAGDLEALAIGEAGGAGGGRCAAEWPDSGRRAISEGGRVLGLPTHCWPVQVVYVPVTPMVTLRGGVTVWQATRVRPASW